MDIFPKNVSPVQRLQTMSVDFRSIGLALLLLSAVVVVGAQSAQRCSLCGMNMAHMMHVRGYLALDGGQTMNTCGVQCGVVLSGRLGERLGAFEVTDFLGGRRIAASDAHFLFNSSAKPGMSPGLIAFADSTDAVKFQIGFGGEMMRLEAARRRMKEWRPGSSR